MSEMAIDFETQGFNAADVTTGRVRRRRPVQIGGRNAEHGAWEWWGPAEEAHRSQHLLNLESELARQEREAMRQRLDAQSRMVTVRKPIRFAEQFQQVFPADTAAEIRLRQEEMREALSRQLQYLRNPLIHQGNDTPPIEYRAMALNPDWLCGVGLAEEKPMEFEAYSDDPVVECPASKYFPLGQCKQSQLGFARDMAGWKAPAVSEPVAPPKKADPEPTFLYKPRTFEAKVWGADKGCAFKDTVAAMSQPWDGRSA